MAPTSYFDNTRCRNCSNKLLIALVFLMSSFSGCIFAQSDTETLSAAQLEWQTEKLATGVYWKTYLGDELFNSRQSINLIEIFIDSARVEYQLAWSQNEMIKTSEFAKENNAIAAINGSFFSTETGGSIVFMKVDDEVISNGAVNRNFYTESGAIGWDSSGIPEILQKPEDGWHSTHLTTVLSSGPLLIIDSEKRNFNNDPFNQNRHPRTAVGLTDNNRLLLVTVDGRSFQSYGMTIPELAQFFSDLDAVHALNFDGGGSTVMWIRDKKTDGIVNYPSDNFEFDHAGERGVSNALIIKEIN